MKKYIFYTLDVQHCTVTTLSPRQAPDTPKSENLMPLTWATKLPSTTPSNNAISLPSTRARRFSETNLNASSRLALHAQSSQCSREFRNVITPQRKISNVITRQDGCHKLMFLWKDDQYFVTLNDRPAVSAGSENVRVL